MRRELHTCLYFCLQLVMTHPRKLLTLIREGCVNTRFIGSVAPVCPFCDKVVEENLSRPQRAALYRTDDAGRYLFVTCCSQRHYPFSRLSWRVATLLHGPMLTNSRPDGRCPSGNRVGSGMHQCLASILRGHNYRKGCTYRTAVATPPPVGAITWRPFPGVWAFALCRSELIRGPQGSIA